MLGAIYAECLSDANNPIMLSIAVLNVVILYVVAPWWDLVEHSRLTKHIFMTI